MSKKILALAAVCVVAVLVAAPVGVCAEAVNPIAVRDAAAPRVCLVTVENALGIPLAYATGFLLGEGKFAITDLAAVSQPGAARIVLKFRDGATATAKEFGMADPAIGLAAIRLDEPKTDAGGLPLGAAPAEGATDVVIVGWKWGQELNLSIGRVMAGPSGVELATALKTESPKTDVAFLRLEGNRPDVSTGSPVLDGSGSVVGVYLAVIGADRPMIVPSGLLRSALLSAGTQLKPFAAAPKPLWPVAYVALALKPATPAELAQGVRAVKLRSRCSKCSGTGQVKIEKIVGTRSLGGVTSKIVQTVSETCANCKGEGVLCNDNLYTALLSVAEDGAYLTQALDIEQRARDAVAANGQELLKGLGKVGPLYRAALVKQIQADLVKPAGAYPRGVVAYACIQNEVDGPDGKYLILSPHQSAMLLAIRADRLANTGEGQGKGTAAKPTPGTWIILAGVATGQVGLADGKPLHVLPYAWAWGPVLGQGRHPGRTPDPATPTTPKPDGAPDFFGL